MAKKMAKKKTSYQAFPLTQNKHRFFFTTIPIKDLYPYCFVSRRDEDPQMGFQRSLNQARSEDIARYLSKGNGSIPTNIVLSAQDEADVNYSSRTKTINFERTEKAFLVLDGQHRLLGFHFCEQKYDIEHRVPVAIYTGLSRAEEARLFIDINTTQRGVPAALLLDIKQVAQLESGTESEMRQLFDKLATHAKSPLAGRLSKAKSSPGKISRVTFNRAMEPAYKSGFMAGVDEKARFNLMLNYICAFDAELEDASLLVRSSFFEAMFEMFDEVVRASLSESGNAKKESLQKIIRPVAKIDYSSILSEGKTRITKSTFLNLMKAALRKTTKISTDLL